VRLTLRCKGVFDALGCGVIFFLGISKSLGSIFIDFGLEKPKITRIVQKNDV